jgi:hypothetical protein
LINQTAKVKTGLSFLRKQESWVSQCAVTGSINPEWRGKIPHRVRDDREQKTKNVGRQLAADKSVRGAISPPTRREFNSMSKPISQTMSEFAVDLKYDDLPDNVITEVKSFL